MKLNLTLVETLTPQKFAAERRFFVDKEAGNIFDRFIVFIANALGHAMVHGDVTHVNSILAAARVMRQYRLTQRMIRGIVPFEYDKNAEQFVGKADTAKLNTLRAVIDDNGVTAPRWEHLLQQKLNAEDKKEKKAAAEWDLLTVVTRLVKAAEAHGCTKSDVLTAVKDAA